MYGFVWIFGLVKFKICSYIIYYREMLKNGFLIIRKYIIINVFIICYLKCVLYFYINCFNCFILVLLRF